MTSMKHTIKNIIQGTFGLFGLRISRRPKAMEYWGTGNLTPIEENSVELYDRFYSDGEALEKYYQGLRLEFYADVTAELKAAGVNLNGRTVLDVGCGVGYLLAELAKAFTPASLSGSDFSEKAMEASRERFPGVTFFQHDIYDPLVGTYDIILCTEVLEHLEKPWVGLQHLRDALNPGGSLILTVPEGRRDYSSEHINFWSPEGWKAFLERECQDARSVQCRVLKNIFNFAIVQF
jgi:2-polyprenyl-3-methyl-5-hydroxy-6-metoxy-1,4-benzoquinol methylase